MRISDWSSDVCSSDLHETVVDPPPDAEAAVGEGQRRADPDRRRVDRGDIRQIGTEGRVADRRVEPVARIAGIAERPRAAEIGRAACRERGWQYGENSGVAVSVKKKKIENIID